MPNQRDGHDDAIGDRRPAADWDPPADWTAVRTVDAHAGGEPLRIVVDGLPPVEGDTMLAKRRHFRAELDHLRTALVHEPRGHADMYAAVPTDPVTDDGDLGVLFLHNDGYSTMCGHGVVALGTVAVETGVLGVDGAESTVRLDTPAGRVTARPTVDGGRATRVAFENVPSFVAATDRRVDVPGYGVVPYDLAFGGAFYAYVSASDLGVGLAPGDVDALVDAGRAVKAAVADDVAVDHPTEPDLGYLYGVVVTGPPEGDADVRNVTVFADGEVDRCPTGTGVSGHLALRHARGDLAPGDPLTVESVVGSTFTGRVVGRTTVGDRDAVVPEVAGSAHLTGRHEFLVDPADPLGDGFLLR
ncbi:MAG: proline racemase family protein [Haloferacaceae archaeon]